MNLFASITLLPRMPERDVDIKLNSDYRRPFTRLKNRWKNAAKSRENSPWKGSSELPRDNNKFLYALCSWTLCVRKKWGRMQIFWCGEKMEILFFSTLYLFIRIQQASTGWMNAFEIKMGPSEESVLDQMAKRIWLRRVLGWAGKARVYSMLIRVYPANGYDELMVYGNFYANFSLHLILFPGGGGCERVWATRGLGT